MSEQETSEKLLKLAEKSSVVIVKHLAAIKEQIDSSDQRLQKIEKSVGCLLTLFLVLAVFGTLAGMFLAMVPR